MRPSIVSMIHQLWFKFSFVKNESSLYARFIISICQSQFIIVQEVVNSLLIVHVATHTRFENLIQKIKSAAEKYQVSVGEVRLSKVTRWR